MGQAGMGVFDRDLSFDDQLRADVEYDRPPRGGEELFDLIGDLSGTRILDLGCGLAPYRERIERKGARWVGMDLAGPGCSVIADGNRMPFADGTFGGVLCAALLEHMPEPDQTMAELWRVVADGGKIFGYTAFLEPLHGLSYFHMSHLGLEYLLLKHGFRPLRIYPSHIAAAYHVERMLFPRRVPGIQPLFRRLSQGILSTILWANRFMRETVLRLQRRSGAEILHDRRQYRRLLSLRYAIGFNFIAERGSLPDRVPSGYRAMVKEGG